MPELTIDNEQDVLVNFPAGKVKKNGYRTTMKGQKGVTCLISSVKKLSFFSEDSFDNKKIYYGLKSIKKALEKQDLDNALIKAEEVIQNLGVSITEILANRETIITSYNVWKLFQSHKDDSLEAFFNTFSTGDKIYTLYEYLLEKAFPSFQIKKSIWKPSDGPDELMNELRQHGALLVVGKFGLCFHGHNKKNLNRNPELDTENRIIYTFKPNTYTGDGSLWTHAVIIDQVKLVKDSNGGGARYMVFFRDPCHTSKPNVPETIFALSYDSFSKRIAPTISHVDENTYGLYSNNPDNLTNAPLEPVPNFNYLKYGIIGGGLIALGGYLLRNSISMLRLTPEDISNSSNHTNI